MVYLKIVLFNIFIYLFNKYLGDIYHVRRAVLNTR